MAQTTQTPIADAPTVVTGTEVIQAVNDLRESLISSNYGASRPAYATAGTVWADSDNDRLNYFDGISDYQIGTISGGVFKVVNSASADTSLACSGNAATATTSDKALAMANGVSNEAGNFHHFVNDGGGNIGQRWNATAGSPNLLVEDGIAYELEIANDSNDGDFIIYQSQNGLAGDTIVWTERFRIDGATDELYSSGNKVFHAGNDGAGSGLDADTVDGIQGSNIVTKTSNQALADTNALDISGTTIILNKGNGGSESVVIPSQSKDAGALGTYALLCHGTANANIIAGTNYAASVLRRVALTRTALTSGGNVWMTDEGAPAGSTWKAMQTADGGYEYRAVIFVRVA